MDVETVEFGHRLRQALLNAGHKASAPVLMRAFNALDPAKPLSVSAAYKWINGRALPTHYHVRLLSNWLAVSPVWLRYGNDQRFADSPDATEALEANNFLMSFASLGAKDKKLVRILIGVLAKQPEPKPA